MKLKELYLISFVFLLNGCFSASKIKEMPISETNKDKRLVIAVVDFDNKTGDPDYDSSAKSITGILIDEIHKTRKFRLVERNRLQAILDELKLNMTGLIDPMRAKEVGNQLGVDALLFGSLSSVKYSKNKQTIVIMYTEGKKVEVSVDARLIDVETGELISSGKASSYVKQRNWVAFWFAKLGKSVDKKSIVEKGLELAAKQLAINLASQ
ncbi:MAG: hypothetical protein JW871_07515 [Endomicrobiales bacterium]|nr:hypothetical protein [Endomicrobiales bacterium]